MLIKLLLLVITILTTIMLIVFFTGLIINMSWFLKSHDIEEFPLRWIVLFVIHLIVIIIFYICYNRIKQHGGIVSMEKPILINFIMIVRILDMVYLPFHVLIRTFATKKKFPKKSINLLITIKMKNYLKNIKLYLRFGKTVFRYY